jgi:NAD+ kinase
MLTALRASADAGTPVGVACGSLGALSGVSAERIAEALERLLAGDWTPRALPALAIETADGDREWALNDLVIVRRGAGQIAAAIAIDAELYVRLAGGGLIVATALGSSAYSMAVGGPVMGAGPRAFVCAPLAMHGGTAPSLVIPAGAKLIVDVSPGYAGFDVEIDGHRVREGGNRFEVVLQDAKATLVSFGAPGHGIAAPRRRRLIADSPRILAPVDRAAHLAAEAEPPR